MSCGSFRYILASSSPRRKELLGFFDIEFEVIPAVGDEVITSSDPARVVEELSFQKAHEVFEGLTEVTRGPDRNNDDNKKNAKNDDEEIKRTVVIGADTVVAVGGQILGKPKDHDDAVRMLKLLSGNTHEVFTGVTLICSGKVITFHDRTVVRISDISDEEIEKYIEREQPYDKAGSYGIQGSFALFLEGIEGNYHNVMGLPVERLYRAMKENGLII